MLLVSALSLKSPKKDLFFISGRINFLSDYGLSNTFFAKFDSKFKSTELS